MTAEAIASVGGLVLNVAAVGWIYYNLGNVKQEVRGITIRLQRIENLFSLKLKKERE